jgi:hypothetical protein
MGRIATVGFVLAVIALAVWAALPSAGTHPSGHAPIVAAPPSPAPPASPGSREIPLPPPSPEQKDVAAEIEACVAAQREVAARRQQRGAPSPPGEPSDAGLVSRACAPLYRQAGCRDAMLRFDEPPPERRSATVFSACARVYCPLLSPPRPSACTDPETVPSDMLPAWTELRQAILTHDIGPAAARRVLAPPG